MTANLARSYSSAPYADNVTPFPIRKRLAHAEEAGAPTRADRLTVIAAIAVFAGVVAVFAIMALFGVPTGDSALYGP